MKKLIITLILLGMYTNGFCPPKKTKKRPPRLVSSEERLETTQAKKLLQAQKLKAKLKELDELTDTLPPDHVDKRKSKFARTMVKSYEENPDPYKNIIYNDIHYEDPLTYVERIFKEVEQAIWAVRPVKVKWDPREITGEEVDLHNKEARTEIYGQKGRNEHPTYTEEEKALFTEMESEEMASFDQRWR